MVSRKEKGDFLEDIVSKLHALPGIKTEKNVMIREIGPSGHKREFDVVIDIKKNESDSEKFFIECKNWNKEIGIEHIEQFAGKLSAIGITPDKGIFVSAKGFKQSVAKRAKERGLSVWEVNGLNKEGLGKIAGSAFSNKILLLLVVESINSFDYGSDERIPEDIPKKIHKKWIAGDLSMDIGSHTLTIKRNKEKVQGLPDGLLGTYIIDYNIIAIAITTDGNFYRYDLQDPENKTISKTHFDAKFYYDKKAQINMFFSEQKLQNYLNSQEGFRISVNKIPAPKIQFLFSYYPLSRKAQKKLNKIRVDKREPSFAEIEGFDLSALWEK